MSRRWEGYLSKAEAEAPRFKAEAGSSPSATDQLTAKAKEAAGSNSHGGAHATKNPLA
ncbi:hypothetical protein ABIB45_003189 [Arthrobacter sp. UYCo732]